MRWGLAVAVGLVAAGCRAGEGYRRPPDRNTDAIGSPAVGVGTDGFETGRTLAQVRSNAAPVPVSVTQTGRVLAIDDGAVLLQRPTGESLRLEIDQTTTVTLNGLPSRTAAIPEGAEARAAYLVDGTRRLVQRMDVKTDR